MAHFVPFLTFLKLLLVFQLKVVLVKLPRWCDLLLVSLLVENIIVVLVALSLEHEFSFRVDGLLLEVFNMPVLIFKNFVDPVVDGRPFDVRVVLVDVWLAHCFELLLHLGLTLFCKLCFDLCFVPLESLSDLISWHTRLECGWLCWPHAVSILRD